MYIPDTVSSGEGLHNKVSGAAVPGAPLLGLLVEAVMLVARPQGAKKVKEAAPLLSTDSCLKRLLGLSDRMAAGSILFTAWSTPQHRPVQCTNNVTV